MMIGALVFTTILGLVTVGVLLSIRQEMLSIRHEIGLIQSATSRNSRDIRDNSQDIRDSNDLVATHVGHELRTPLTTISGTLATLEKNHDRIPPEQQCDMLRAAMQQAEVLESLITGMISLEPSKTNEGTAFAGGLRRFSGARGLAKRRSPNKRS
jgi:signal transduction histidine kinase